MLPIGVVGVKLGLYRHYKSTDAEPKLYRVLFTAIWSDDENPRPTPDARVYLFPGSDVGHFKRVKIPLFASTRNTESDFAAMVAMWSGNTGGGLELGELVVIYVALYGDGRVSARTVEEFEEQVQQPNDTFMRPRFEWVGL